MLCKVMLRNLNDSERSYEVGLTEEVLPSCLILDFALKPADFFKEACWLNSPLFF